MYTLAAKILLLLWALAVVARPQFVAAQGTLFVPLPGQESSSGQFGGSGIDAAELAQSAASLGLTAAATALALGADLEPVSRAAATVGTAGSDSGHGHGHGH